MLPRTFLTLLLILLFPGHSLSGVAPPETLDRVIKALESPFGGESSDGQAIRDFQGSFTQESHLVSLDRTRRGRGRVAVKFDFEEGANRRLTRFSWEYDQPEPQEIVSDGRNLWVYLPENRQVIQSEIDDQTQGRPGDPMSFLTGLGNLSRDFAVEWADPDRDGSGNFVVELAPRQPSPLIRKLVIVVSRKAAAAAGGPRPEKPVFPIVAVTVIDPNGNTTRIDFQDILINQDLDGDRFQFTIPDGVEVVHPAPVVPNS